MVLLFLSSGLFLGWSLGANDAANVFGSAVGSRMVRFKKAAIIAGIFVILGAVFQGAGASHTLGKLGAVDAIAGSFTAALTVFWMTRLKVPVSTSQAIVGAIIGWNLYTGNVTDTTSLIKIISTWISGPIMGAVFAIILYLILNFVLKKVNLHLLKRDAYLRTGLLAVGAFGSFSLGANNIANVMGVFVPAIPLETLDFGIISFSGAQQLFFIGGLAIAIGIFTYSRKVMETVGSNLMPLSGETAMIVVLAHSLVLFVFSSQGLSNAFQSIGLPAIPLVPVSSSQAIVGAIIGIGLIKGGRNIKLRVLGGITAGWVTTPIIAGVVSLFLLFFVNNVFMLPVQTKTEVVVNQQIEEPKVIENIITIDSVGSEVKGSTDSIKIVQTKGDKDESAENANKEISRNLLIEIGIAILIIIGFLIYHRYRKIKYKSLQKQLTKKEKKVNSLKEKLRIQERNNDLEKNLSKNKIQSKEFTDMALSIIQKNDFLKNIKMQIMHFKVRLQEGNNIGEKEYNQLMLQINQNLNVDKERDTFYQYAEKLNSEFKKRLLHNYPNLTTNEIRLCTLIRINLTTKEIASLLNISPKSVEMSRYRLRKKLKVNKDENLSIIIGKV